MEFAERLVQAAAVEFRKPEEQRAENRERCGDAHHQMKVPGDEIVGDRGYCDVVACEEQSRKSTGKKQRDEPDGKEHRGRQPNLSGPHRTEPACQKH